MSTTSELDFSGTPGLNTDINGVSVAEGIPPSNLNDAIRAMASFRHDAITRIVGKAAGTYTAVKADHNQAWYCAAATVNLTAAATLGNGWSLWVKAATGAVVIDPAGSELIEGAASLSLPIGSAVRILCTGSVFYTFADSVGTAAVTLTGTQTLTNKTLTSPAISNPTLTGTVTGNGAFTGGVSGATVASSGSVSAAGGNIYMDVGGTGRFMQFESNFYWDFNTTTKLLRWIRAGTEEFHIGDSGITASANVFSESGRFVATGTIAIFAGTGTNVTGGLYLRPRGENDSTFQGVISATTGNFSVTSVSETSDDTLKKEWNPSNRSLVNDIATLEVGSFKWKNTGTDGYGVKAQALRAIMPEVVIEDEDGLLGVSYGKGAMGIVIDACRRIVALEARIAELEARAT